MAIIWEDQDKSNLDLKTIDLKGAEFRNCNFENTSFKELTDAVFINCNLTKVTFNQASVKGLHIHDCSGVEKNALFSCCWNCSRFDKLSDETTFRNTITKIYGTLHTIVTK